MPFICEGLSVDVIEWGIGEYKLTDPDDFREWIRDNKRRDMVDKRMDEGEAIKKFVKDGDYVSYDLCGLIRGPMVLEREIVRQRKRNLWTAAKFTILDSEFLIGGGCVNKVDVGFAGVGKALYSAVEEGRVKTIDWDNGTLALRHLAGAMGVPFLPTRALMGTDTLKRSGAKVVRDPFTGKKICLVPAIHPDVALIHAHQSDEHGNARVFGASVSPYETAAASKRVIVCAEEIIDRGEVRKNPDETTIPYYMVDAVVEASFASHPGTCPGRYFIDVDHVTEFLRSQENADDLEKYYEKYVHSVENHAEYLERRVGKEKLLKLQQIETIREGYYV